MKEATSRGEPLARWVAPTVATQVDQIPLAEVHASWSPERTGELPIDAAVALLRAIGVVDPVLLRPRGGGGYEVITGHRTVAAARQAGLERIPAVVRELDDAQALTALALDGSTTGRFTAAGAVELRTRLLAAGRSPADVEEVMAAAPAAPVAEPVAPAAVAAVPAATAGRWLPLPAGRPRLARMSSAFVDVPRMLRRLAEDGFTGTVELVAGSRTDALAFLDGTVVAAFVEELGQRHEGRLRLPSPESGAVVEITVRPHAGAVVVAVALAVCGPTRLTGLHASFLHLPGLLEVLGRERADAAVTVSAPAGAGVILLAQGRVIAAYARRHGEGPGEDAEAGDVPAVAELIAGEDGDIDVHSGGLGSPLDLEEMIAGATTAGAA